MLIWVNVEYQKCWYKDNPMYYFLGDRIPPQVDTNEQLEVQEGMSETISTDFLSASDVNSDSDMLQYTVIEPPDLGHIAFAHDLGMLAYKILTVKVLKYSRISHGEQRCSFSI